MTNGAIVSRRMNWYERQQKLQMKYGKPLLKQLILWEAWKKFFLIL